MSDANTTGQLLESTAYWTAAVRSMEHARPDRLFEDPWAARLAGTEGKDWIEQRTADSVIPIVIRTRYFDDFLQRALAESAIRQIVLMAAGLDTRSFRLVWPQELRIYELDQPQVLAYKERTLRASRAQATCERIPIAVDLTSSWQTALAEAGFDLEHPSAWLLEGFLFYLSNEDLIRVLDQALRLAAAGSVIGFDIVNSETLVSPLTKGWVDMQAKSGAPWRGTLDDPSEFLAARGWKARLSGPGAPDANYGRWTFPAIPVTMPGMPHLWFVTGDKQR